MENRVSWEFEEGRFILCEGPHDKYFLDALISARQLGAFQIRTSHECCGRGGVDGFGPAIYAFPTIAGFKELKGIAIITDNDNPETLPSIERKLQDYGYTSMIPRKGKIGTEPITKPVIIIPLPDDNDWGDLEKLCLPALYHQWPGAEECVTAYLKCTGALQWAKQQQLHKAKVRAVISAYYENDPYKGVGYFFSDNKQLTEHRCFDKLTSILKRFDEIITAIDS